MYCNDDQTFVSIPDASEHFELFQEFFAIGLVFVLQMTPVFPILFHPFPVRLLDHMVLFHLDIPLDGRLVVQSCYEVSFIDRTSARRVTTVT